MKLIILLLVVGVAVLVLFILLRKPVPVDCSIATYVGPISEYKGNKKLVVAFTASWASMWKLTAEELKKLDKERFDLAILDQATHKTEIKRFGIAFLPSVALVENGKIVKSIQNLSSIEQIKDW
jgi:thioredoxin-like negative regulator of GroEL